MTLLIRFLLMGTMFLVSNCCAQTIELCDRGLNLFPMGKKLNEKIRLELQDIDTSDYEGKMEYSLAALGTDIEDQYTFKKLKPGAYKLKGLESILTNIYIGYTKEYEIRQIVLKLGNHEFSNIKELFDHVYGSAKFSSTTDMNGTFSHQSILWAASDFDILFSGLGGDIRFYYPRSAAYMERKYNIKKN